jgi:hypothetical protein
MHSIPRFKRGLFPCHASINKKKRERMTSYGSGDVEELNSGLILLRGRGSVGIGEIIGVRDAFRAL